MKSIVLFLSLFITAALFGQASYTAKLMKTDTMRARGTKLFLKDTVIAIDLKDTLPHTAKHYTLYVDNATGRVYSQKSSDTSYIKTTGDTAYGYVEFRDSIYAKNIAVGYQRSTLRSGIGAIAAGYSCIAGDYSAAFGYSNVASLYNFGAGYGINIDGANGCFSFGQNNNISSGDAGAFALGRSSVGYGAQYGSGSVGYNDTAAGSYGVIAIGDNCDASGAYGVIAMGKNSRAYSNLYGVNEKAAVAIGNFARSYGASTLAVNDSTLARGYASFAAGKGTRAIDTVQFVIGIYNDTIDTTNVFVIGSGTADGARSNSLTVSNVGDVKIAGMVKADYGYQYSKIKNDFASAVSDTIFSIPLGTDSTVAMLIGYAISVEANDSISSISGQLVLNAVSDSLTLRGGVQDFSTKLSAGLGTISITPTITLASGILYFHKAITTNFQTTKIILTITPQIFNTTQKIKYY